MKVFVTKASDDYWYQIKVFDSLKDIQKFIKKWQHSIIIESNPYIDDDMFRFWDGMNEKDIPVIRDDCPLHIIIRDDYA
jgi:hypothetical protein